MAKDGAGLFNWFYSQHGEVSGYTNVLWSGITTVELARAIQAALEQDLAGLYHLAPKDTISKFDLLQLFKEVFDRRNIELKPVEGEAVGTTLTSAKKDFRYQVPDYQTMVHDMKVWIEKHPKLYKHYER